MLGSPPRFIFVIRTQIHTHITHTHNFFIPSTTERRRLPHISFLLLLTSQSKATTPNSTPPHNFCTLQTLLYTPHQISLLSLSLSLFLSLTLPTTRSPHPSSILSLSLRSRLAPPHTPRAAAIRSTTSTAAPRQREKKEKEKCVYNVFIRGSTRGECGERSQDFQDQVCAVPRCGKRWWT